MLALRNPLGSHIDLFPWTSVAQKWVIPGS